MLRATCDDAIRVWIDGVLQTQTTGVNNWIKVTEYEYSDCAQVIAVECTDKHDVAMGMLAETSTGVVSDGSWKCTRTYQAGWEHISFNDGGWSNANVYGPNPTSPWNYAIPSISGAAKWIGSGSKTDVSPGGTGPKIFCRRNLC